MRRTPNLGRVTFEQDKSGDFVLSFPKTMSEEEAFEHAGGNPEMKGYKWRRRRETKDRIEIDYTPI